ncbi:MAG: DUF1553 domain-containing protein [Planctomycetes bacterium]|nr:DUF1553 domain-containing protein [Planctomycetota bacterium]
MKLHHTMLSNWSLSPVAACLALASVLGLAMQDDASAKPATRAAKSLDPAAIDAMLDEAWTQHAMKGDASTDDAEWLRRASLALDGVIPTADETNKFLGDHAQFKRSKKIDELIARKEFGEHFGGEWALTLIGRGGRQQRFDRRGFTDWVEEQFNKNMPFNEFTKSVLTATGRSDDNPAVGYIERWEAEPKDLAGQTAKVFLGVQIQCARCHDHKDQQWKKDEFNNFAAYFGKTQLKRTNVDGMRIAELADLPEQKRNKTVGRFAKKQLEDRAKAAKNPEQAQKIMEKVELGFQEPHGLRPLESGPLAIVNAVADVSTKEGEGENQDTQVDMTRRERLAAWITAPGNPFYAREIVNSTFARIFGYGLINPVDDFRSDSTVAVPELLEALARDFESSGFDYKRLVGNLVKTKAFALASNGESREKEEAREAREKLFARYTTRPLSPEQLFDSIARATGIDELAEQAAKSEKPAVLPKKGKGKMMMGGEGEAKMFGNIRRQAIRRFITTFDDDESGEDLDFEGTIPQALLMMNGKFTTESISRGLTIQRAMARGNDKIDWLYLSALSRKPTSDEKAKATAYLQKHDGEKRENYEDILWALINSAEFSAIH